MEVGILRRVVKRGDCPEFFCGGAGWKLFFGYPLNYPCALSDLYRLLSQHDLRLRIRGTSRSVRGLSPPKLLDVSARTHPLHIIQGARHMPATQNAITALGYASGYASGHASGYASSDHSLSRSRRGGLWRTPVSNS